MRSFLHVGCGNKYKDRTTRGFNTDDWDEIRFDIDTEVNPDITGSLTDLSLVETSSMDALFSSHNIEHLFPHEVPTALNEFNRVLKSDGFVVITCPDLKSVCRLIAQDRLMEPAYSSPAGPIAPIDILYGFRPSLREGNHYMAHKCGFTEKVLRSALSSAGFVSIASISRAGPFFDLWAVATKAERSNAELTELFKAYTYS